MPRAVSLKTDPSELNGDSERTVQKLSSLGHSIDQEIGPIGGAQAIKINENGVLEGASDPRKDGSALGY